MKHNQKKTHGQDELQIELEKKINNNEDSTATTKKHLGKKIVKNNILTDAKLNVVQMANKIPKKSPPRVKACLAKKNSAVSPHVDKTSAFSSVVSPEKNDSLSLNNEKPNTVNIMLPKPAAYKISMIDRSTLTKQLVGRLTAIKLIADQKGYNVATKVAVPKVSEAQLKKKDDRLIISFKDIFYSSNLMSKINLFLYAQRKIILILLCVLLVVMTIGMGVGFGYFKKYKGYPDGGNFFSFPGSVDGSPGYDPSRDALFNRQVAGPSLANDFTWGQIDYSAPLNNYNGQLYLMGNSSSANARDELDVKKSRWGAVHRDHLLYKYSEFDGPILRFGHDIATMTNKKLWTKYFSQKFYIKKTKKWIYPGGMQKMHDAYVNNLMTLRVPIITYDDRFKLNAKKEVPGTINPMTNLIYNVLQQGTIVNNSIGLPTRITGGGNDGNAYLRDPYIMWVDANKNQAKYKKHSSVDLKKHPELGNDYFNNYIKNSFSPHKGLITNDSRLGPANVSSFPLVGILDQNAYYYPAIGSNVLSRVPSGKLFVCTSPLSVDQFAAFYYWVFSKQSDSIHDNNYWDDSNIHN